MIDYELALFELGSRPALALQYIVAVQVRMWRIGYRWDHQQAHISYLEHHDRL